jgi:CheY-like chemotaxis protein
MKTKNFTILVIDDSEDDLIFILRAWQRLGVTNPIQTVRSGDEAIAYLRGDGKYSHRSIYTYPSFITIDLKTPSGDGLSVLEYLKRNPERAVIATAVLSASRDLDDIKKSYMLGASSFLVKPASLGELQKMLKTLYDYWRMCEIPQIDDTGKQISTYSTGKIGERYSPPS